MSKKVEQFNIEFEHAFHLVDSNETYPEFDALYFVYRVVKEDGGSKLFLKELLYIGKSDTDVHSRVNEEHERKDEWYAKLKDGESLYYITATVDGDSDALKKVENAFVYKYQPVCNDKDKKENFNCDSVVWIKTNKSLEYLEQDFKVERLH